MESVFEFLKGDAVAKSEGHYVVDLDGLAKPRPIEFRDFVARHHHVPSADEPAVKKRRS